ncbi:tetratricopeptide repeat protein [Streptomyces sp. NPDC005728]|uniref:tetratricopeptide repeat protein n=1 Tax=Streptomyces sp. NPDC005728 TaxID=3157054 RepID=UPI0033E3E2E4
MVAPRLVLTAHHMVGDNAEATVTTPGGAPTRCQVVWARSDDPYDAALLLADRDLVDDPAAVRWGRIVVPDAAEISVRGFPALASRRGRVGSGEFRGWLLPQEAVEADRYVLELEGSPPLAPAKGSPWAGLSGGAVWCKGTLVGVAVADLPGWPHSRVDAVPGYVLFADDDFRALIEQHAGRKVELEPAEFSHIAEAAAPLVPRSVATLLHPRAEVVTFTGRRELLAEMVEWSTSDRGVSLALLTGAGGAGKSRIARELGHRLAESGYAVVHLARRSSADDHRLLARVTAPVLLVIDYAETRVDQINSLLDRLCRRPSGVPFKVLLIARAVGQWWEEVSSGSPEAVDVAAATRRWSISGTASLGVDRDAAFRSAVVDLSRGVAALGPAADAPEEPLALPSQDSWRRPPGTVLEIHMAALASILASTHPRSTATMPQETLLGHEAKYWRNTSQRAPLDRLGDAALRNAVVAATLVGPVPRGRAYEIVGHVPRIGDHPESVRRAVADWLRDLYPRPESVDPADSRHWGALEPDPLGEYLVGTRVADEPEIFLRLLEALDEDEIENALLVLSRAAAQVDADALKSVLRTAVRESPARLARGLVAAGTRSAEPSLLISALDQILGEALLPPEDLQELSYHVPPMTQALASWGVRLHQRLAQLLDEQTERTSEVDRAGTLHNLSMRLIAADRHEEALDVATSAVEFLEQADPDTATHQPLLNGLLLGQRAQALWALGRAKESLVAGRKAIVLLSAWKPEDDTDRLFVLAGTLNNHSHSLAAAGYDGEALEVARKSVAIRRELASVDPSLHPDLARSLNTLTLRHHEAGRYTEALEAVEESLRIRRHAAQSRPDAYADELASALTNKANVLRDSGDAHGALEAAREAVGIKRRLARSNPEMQLAEATAALRTFSTLSDAVGEQAEAMEAAMEATDMARRLVVSHGRAHLGLLASCFLVQAQVFRGMSCGMLAFRVNNKAAQVFRLAYRDDPAISRGLLSALTNQVTLLTNMNRLEDAERAAAEAVSLLVGLPADFAEGLGRKLTTSLAAAHVTHAERLLALGRVRESRGACDAALALHTELEADAPGSCEDEKAKVRRLRTAIDGAGSGQAPAG